MKYARIFLIGFRTTGKSSLGKLLAKSLGLEFIETDQIITDRKSKTIDEITEYGTQWEEFREEEYKILKELINKNKILVSTGGGMPTNDILNNSGKTFGEMNSEILKRSKDSLTILLTAPNEVIEKRIVEGNRRRGYPRPILDQETAKKIRDLKDQKLIDKIVEDSLKALEKRKILYEEVSDLEIDTSRFELPKSLQNLNVSIGDPVKHSLSPIMHNAGYKALGIENTNLFIPCRVKKEKLEKFIEAVKTLGINGISVTLPHKQAVMKYLDIIDETAKKIGAVNTVLNIAGKLTGYNTDWIGAITALEKKTDLKGKKVAIIGAGGAAKAIVFGLIKKGAKVKIFNRTLEKAEELVKELGGEVGGIGEMREIGEYDIIINATSVGMGSGESPVDKDFINKKQIVFDIVYSPMETQLIKDAKEKGAKVIYGYEMLLYQGVEQFKMYTGYEAPVREMEEALIKSL